MYSHYICIKIKFINSLDFHTNFRYGLLGSSGCGKTTILSCIVGLRKLDEGKILVCGAKPGTRESGIPGPRVGYIII